MQRNRAIVFWSSLRTTVASHTWVIRPRCTGRAVQAIVPSRAVPRKLVLSSTVVNVALPKIGRELPSTLFGVLEGQSYVYNGYLLTVSALLILAGIMIAAGWAALFQLRRRSRRAARPVAVTPPPALDPPPVSERTPA